MSEIVEPNLNLGIWPSLFELAPVYISKAEFQVCMLSDSFLSYEKRKFVGFELTHVW